MGGHPGWGVTGPGRWVATRAFRIGNRRKKKDETMKHEELLRRISVDPGVCCGKPCIRGHRIWVSLILDFLAAGATVDEILEDYPQITAEDIRACIAFGSEMTRERTVHVS